MAEDKRIRVSADASPLQELRQEAQALWNDFNKMEDSFKSRAEETVDVIQKQIDLLKERNTLAEGSNIGGQQNTPSTGQISLIDPYTGRPLGRDNITPGAFGREPIDPTRRTDRISDDPSDNAPGTLERIAGTNELNERQGDVLKQILAEVTRIADTLEKGERDDTNGVLPNASGTPSPALQDTGEDTEDSESNSDGGILGGKSKLPAGLSGVMAAGALLMGIGSMFGQQAKYEARQYGAENEFQRQNNIGTHWLLNKLSFGITGANAEKLEVGRMAAAQNDRALNNLSSLHNYSYTGALRTQLGDSFGDDIGDVMVRSETDRTGATNVVNRDIFAASQQTGWGTYSPEIVEADGRRLSEQSRLRSQITALDANPNANISEDEYHTWASRTLGLNITDYTDKVANLQRAGVYGGNTSLGDINQLLMAGRIRGLSEDASASVLSTTRFDNSGTTGANVVQAFDTNLQGQGRSDQYIASTLEEYLQQFNRVAEQVLSRTGSIDTGSIVNSMTSIQNATRMEGRQLDRVQNSLMGNDISQDDVTQALLLRTAREVAGPDAQLSDLQAMIEQMPNKPELQQQFFERIQTMTGGGEMGRQVLSQIFPNLTMTDIIDLERATGNEAEEIWGRGRSRGGQYSEENAQSKVGPAELSSAGTSNRQIIDGYSEILNKIGSSLKEVLETIEKPIPVMVVRVPAGSAGSLISEDVSVNPEYSTSDSQIILELKGLRRDLKNGINVDVP